jgi:simple sugar transport system ATP-binding protein
MDVELTGINKTFGTVHANEDINLKIPSGTIQGILGENGAGKSTLMKVLSGFIQADSGQILLDGRPVEISSPADAIQHGIGMLHQDPLDFPPMKVIDNFLVGSEDGRARGIFPNYPSLSRSFENLQKQFDFSIDPYSYVDSLTVGERQQLEILRLLWLGAQVLILDEPTTGISAPQKIKLFATLHLLAEEGKTIIFVSHKLEDVEQLCSRVAVLRRGKLVGEAEPPYAIDQLVTQMFGKAVTLGKRISCMPGTPPALLLKNINIEDSRLRINNVNLEVCEGQVIGLAGMEGSGQGLFLRACAGLVRPVAGKIFVGGKDLTGKNYHAFMQHGVAFMPASRMEEGLIPGLSLTEHFILSKEQKGLFVDQELAKTAAQQGISDFNIRGAPASTVESLSGGNQQRALLALMRTPLSVILMEHPTRGLDIESAIYIWKKLKERTFQGASIVFISSDLEEILHYSDRILVFFAGKVSKPLNAEDTSVDQLGQLIGGKGWGQVTSDQRLAISE